MPRSLEQARLTYHVAGSVISAAVCLLDTADSFDALAGAASPPILAVKAALPAVTGGSGQAS